MISLKDEESGRCDCRVKRWEAGEHSEVEEEAGDMTHALTGEQCGASQHWSALCCEMSRNYRPVIRHC